MTAVLEAAAAVAAVVVLGAYIRWAVGPVADAYRLGLTMGRQLGAKPGGRHSAPVSRPPALEVAAAWLMPWRSVRTIHGLERQRTLLIRTIAHAVTGHAETMTHQRPSGSEWYDRPLPIAAMAAVLRPARAVRKLRSSDDAIAWMVDAAMAQERKRHSDTGPQAAVIDN